MLWKGWRLNTLRIDAPALLDNFAAFPAVNNPAGPARVDRDTSEPCFGAAEVAKLPLLMLLFFESLNEDFPKAPILDSHDPMRPPACHRSWAAHQWVTMRPKCILSGLCRRKRALHSVADSMEPFTKPVE